MVKISVDIKKMGLTLTWPTLLSNASRWVSQVKVASQCSEIRCPKFPDLWKRNTLDIFTFIICVPNEVRVENSSLIYEFFRNRKFVKNRDGNSGQNRFCEKLKYDKNLKKIYFWEKIEKKNRIFSEKNRNFWGKKGKKIEIVGKKIEFFRKKNRNFWGKKGKKIEIVGKKIEFFRKKIEIFGEKNRNFSEKNRNFSGKNRNFSGKNRNFWGKKSKFLRKVNM